MPAVMEKSANPEQGFYSPHILTGKFPQKADAEMRPPLSPDLPRQDVRVVIDSPNIRTSHEFPLDEDSEPHEAGTHEADAPVWLGAVIDRLNELLALPVNWDQQGALRIEIADLTCALDTLTRVMYRDTPAPTIVPIRGGGLQLEWHRAGLDVEIVVGLGEDDGLYFSDPATGLDWEGPTFDGFTEHGLAIRLIG
ncbi:MAG TPA: hypothetical protein VIE64_06985 [Solirubrobacterales bacterium]|jgi:hypothetical protein